MHPLKQQYYRSRYVVTIRLRCNNQFTIEGGIKEKKALEYAKTETNFCYVKNSTNGAEVKLILHEGEWKVSL